MIALGFYVAVALVFFAQTGFNVFSIGLGTLLTLVYWVVVGAAVTDVKATRYLAEKYDESHKNK